MPQPRPRLTIRSLLVIVALVAVQISALRSGEDSAVEVCRLVTAAVLVFATYLARRRRGEAGAFWFGFAVLGWAAFVLVVDVLAARPFPAPVISWLPRMVLEMMVDRTASNSYAASQRAICQFRILHLMLVLPIALVAGLVCRMVDGRRRGRTHEGT